MTGIIRLKLKDAASGEARYVSVSADSEAEAVAIVERQEQKHVRFVLDPAKVVEFEQKLRDGTLRGREKGLLFSHLQTKPYQIVKADK